MSYRIEPTSVGNDIVIDGFNKGIAPSPYEGISDIKNSNIISVPDEAGVNFKTFANYQTAITSQSCTVTASSDVVSYTGTAINSNAAITFVSTANGITSGTVYWVGNVSGTSFKLYTTQNLSGSAVDITSDGTNTFSTVNMGIPMYSASTTSVQIPVLSTGTQYLVDSNGRVWRAASPIWIYTGNTTLTNAHGNGLGYYEASDGTGYLFVFRNSLIDYTATATISWVYGWNPADGTTGNTSAVLNFSNGTQSIHETLVGRDNVFYYCDKIYLGSFFEKSGQVFDPTNTATYTFAKKALALPTTDRAQCLAELGTNLLVGGANSFIYPWDRTSTSFSFPIFLSEVNTVKMVTVNTNTFVFCGNRGRIYITNGTQAKLYIKIPDHLSGSLDPIYTWTTAGFNKNQLYFGFKAINNDQTQITNNPYGGLWAVDTDTNALRLSNQLSIGTYTGYAALFIPVSGTVSGGAFYVGWSSNIETFASPVYGVDSTSNTGAGASSQPYSNYETQIDTDMIPVGTLLNPYTPAQLEFKLTTPLVSGEGVKISWRTDLSQSFTQITNGETLTVGAISDVYTTSFEKAQWIQLRINTKSTNSSPSFVRLREIRIRQGKQ